MQNSATIYDVAKKLGVSVATINRALNDKPKVSHKTRELVIKTAAEMGYKGNRIAKSLSGKTVKIGMILEASVHEYIREVELGARHAFENLADYKVTGDILLLNESPEQKKQIFEDRIGQYIQEQYDGLILGVASRFLINFIDSVHAQCPPIATVQTDILDRLRIFSVRPNGKIAGMMAAQMLRWLAGRQPVAIFTGNKEIQIHRETIEGFMEENNRQPLDLIGIFENQDDPDIAYFATGKLLKDHPDVGGIYINSSNSATVCRKIEEMGYTGKIQVVASDIFPEMRDDIMKGAIQASIFQDPFRQGQLAVQSLYRHIIQEEKFPDNILIEPQLILRSNLELFINKMHWIKDSRP
jgi:LacI family transcriptional regulator